MVVPWPVALLTVPHLAEVFAAVKPGVLALTFSPRGRVGLGGIFWGKGIAALGMALGISLLMGLVTVFGSPVLLAFTKGPQILLEPGGKMLLGAVAVMILGVVGLAVAGAARQLDRDRARRATAARAGQRHLPRDSCCASSRRCSGAVGFWAGLWRTY